MSEIGLSEVIRTLRAELEAAMTEGEGQRVRFQPTGIEVEFQVGVTRAKEGKGGLRLWVLELGAGGSYGSESIQRVALSLQPVLAGGGRVEIAQGVDENPLASSAPDGS